MPYCIQCGVKLNHRYTTCPLCSIELEYCSQRESSPPLYPEEVYKISIIKTRANRREWITIHFLGFLTFLIILLTSGINFYISNKLSWSLFITISITYLYMTISSIIHLKRNPLLLYGAVNTLLGLLLYGLDILSGSNSWFIEYALPCFISLQLISLAINIILKKIKSKILMAVTVILIINLFLIIINEIIASSFSWSLIATSVLMPTSLFLIFLNFKIRRLSGYHSTT